MSNPPLAFTSFSAEERCERYTSRLRAAALFLENFQMPQKKGRPGLKRPFGPFGEGNVQSCSAILGLSRLATAYALGGFMMSAPLPAISHLLFDASSHANTSGGRNCTSFLQYSIACRVASDLTVMLPLASISCAPYAAKIAPTEPPESAVPPMPTPNGKPALWHFSAAIRKASHVHLSVSVLSGGPPAGYILVRSRPTCCLNRSMRRHGPFIWLPAVAGTAIQWPSCFPRYSTPVEGAPCWAMSGCTMSSTGSRL